jgi:hypothetical protein
MIFLVTNSIAPYCYDIHQLVGLPVNLNHRFRYSDPWINLPNGIKSIVGKEALIVLRDFNTGNFIPLRFVVIKEVVKIGDFRAYA